MSQSSSQILIRHIEAHETHALRQEILRPAQRLEEMVFDFDEAPETVHFGAFVGETGPMGVASIYQRPAEAKWGAAHPLICSLGAWQLRGMATQTGIRGSGAGGELLQRCLAHATSRGGRVFWCNARTTVTGFYERYGLLRFGEPYDVPHAGPHAFMFTPL